MNFFPETCQKARIYGDQHFVLFVTIAFHTTPSMRHYEVVEKSLRQICHYEWNV